MWLNRIKNTITEAIGEAAQCCFCGDQIKGETPVLIHLDLGNSQTQSMRAHGRCLQERLHHTVPFIAPNEVDSD